MFGSEFGTFKYGSLVPTRICFSSFQPRSWEENSGMSWEENHGMSCEKDGWMLP